MNRPFNPFRERDPSLEEITPRPVFESLAPKGSKTPPADGGESPPQVPLEGPPEQESEEPVVEGAGVRESSATTEMELEEFTFLWTLTNYPAMTNLPEIKSVEFVGGPESKHLWQLKLYPKKLDKENDQEYFSLHLILVAFGDGDDSPSRKVKARFQFNLLGPDVDTGVEYGNLGRKAAEFTKKSMFGFNQMILSSDVLNGPRPLIHGEQKSLQIHVRVWIQKGIKQFPGTSRGDEAVARLRKRKESLAFNMGSLFKAIKATDINIRTETTVFKAHRAVLAARSPVLAKKLKVVGAAKPLDEVFIGGFDNALVEDVIEYFYNGETKLLKERPAEMLVFAEEYELIDLKEDCEAELAEKITIDNALDILILSQQNHAEFLKSEVIDFVNWNREKLMETHSLKDFLKAHPTLAMELFKADTDGKPNPALFHAEPEPTEIKGESLD